MTVRSVFHKLLVVVAALAVVVFVQRAVFAETMSSANYKIQTDSLNLGGGASSSTNYLGNDAIGDLATGEGLTSSSFIGCAGFECSASQPYLTFSVQEGTTSPGTVGAGVNLGTLVPGAVEGSDGSSVNSVFLTVEGVVPRGIDITVRGANGGLARVSQPSTVLASATANLTSVSEGYGVCIGSATQDSASPTTLTETSPYNGLCDKTTNHNVGVVDSTNRSILTSTGSVKAGAAEILVKAKASTTTAAGNDYQDTLTFIATGSY